MKEIELSAYGCASSMPSPANRMMEEFASGFRDGVDINLGVGYVKERTIPAAEVRRALDGPPGSRKPRVVYIPGEICVHPRGDLSELGRRQLRLSYGFEELDSLLRAIVLMREAIAYARR